MKFYPLTQEDHDLIEAARDILRRNHDDEQYHAVGAALRCKNGKVYCGVNCDDIHGSCAEFIAMGNAYCAGERAFDTIVAVHPRAKNGLYAPCGNCRQMLFEYCPDIQVILNNDEGEIVKVDLRDLLPFAWRPLED